MNNKIVIKAQRESNLLDSLKSYMENESLEYTITETISKIDKDITTIIYLDENDIDNISLNVKVPVILISNARKVIKDTKSVVNYIITDLIIDNNNYTDVQKEYLFSKGIYHSFLKVIEELLNNMAVL